MTWVIPGHHPKLSKNGTITSEVESKSLRFKQPHRHSKQSVNQSQTLIDAAFELGCPAKSPPNHCHFLTGVSSTHPPPWSFDVSGPSNAYWTAQPLTQIPLGPQHCWLPAPAPSRSSLNSQPMQNFSTTFN